MYAIRSYYVAVFLLDEGKEWAALRAASSEGGQRMIARNHRLAVGRQGVITSYSIHYTKLYEPKP